MPQLNVRKGLKLNAGMRAENKEAQCGGVEDLRLKVLPLGLIPQVILMYIRVPYFR